MRHAARRRSNRSGVQPRSCRGTGQAGRTERAGGDPERAAGSRSPRREAASRAVAQLQPPADLWERIRRGFAMPQPGERPGAPAGTVVRHAAGLHAAHDRALAQVPVPHRRGTGAAQHADRAGVAALHRKRLQPAGRLQRPRRRHVAVHARHRPVFRTQAERLPRRPSRRAGVDASRAGLPAEALRHVRRLAPGAGRLQLGRRQRRPRDRAQPEERPGHRLRRSQHAQRDPVLRARSCRP